MNSQQQFHSFIGGTTRKRKRKRPTSQNFGFCIANNGNFPWFQGAACSVFSESQGGYVLGRIVDFQSNGEAVVKVRSTNTINNTIDTSWNNTECHMDSLQTAFEPDDRVIVNLQHTIEKWQKYLGTVNHQKTTNKWSVTFDEDGDTLTCDGQHITHSEDSFVRKRVMQEKQQQPGKKKPNKKPKKKSEKIIQTRDDKQYCLSSEEIEDGWLLSPIAQRIRVARSFFDGDIVFGTIVATLLKHEGMMFKNLHEDEDEEMLDSVELKEAKLLWQHQSKSAKMKQPQDQESVKHQVVEEGKLVEVVEEVVEEVVKEMVEKVAEVAEVVEVVEVAEVATAATSSSSNIADSVLPALERSIMNESQVTVTVAKQAISSVDFAGSSLLKEFNREDQ